MNRLKEIIELLQDCVDDWTDPDAQADVQKMKVAIQLLLAGAKMRQSSKTEISEATRAWDAALKGNDG